MESKRKIVFLEPVIVDQIDEFIENYASKPRGRAINLVVSLFLLLDEETQKVYEEKALRYIESNDRISYGLKYGEVRIGRIEVQLFISKKLEDKFLKYNTKTLIVASLLYVGILKDGE